ncbi:hypothetical protein OEZ86_008500 [Tetradesmus obliquus]|uniref:Uncharacterized protein n=2 Tax=Tetradesmus obliquus TaxID=3088 RepID=A0ABY8UP98_TETOB|nr:hypothetical protein OEZ85_004425 [Tetradesmus obliquus]WIA42515.1 hypothetical protein OEZ86_008500 [Tetradesmus obliquus]|eukprot:jgi/Sobl393_1/5716/SZX62408.1
MAAQLYSNTQLAQALYEVLQELVADGKVPEELAVATLDQLDQSILSALKNEIPAKSEVKGNLDTYKYYDNVWQFTLSDVAFKLNASGTGSLKKAPEVTCDKAKIVCVDIKLAPQ